MVLWGAMTRNSLDMYQTAKRHIPKYRSRYTRRYENLKSHGTGLKTSIKGGKFLDQLSEE
jgi:hypothetical protein